MNILSVMLSTARSLWRRARTWPIVRRLVVAADRAWWARTIRRADIVDLEYFAAQIGHPVSARAAVRRYVREGFRNGLSLNPLVCERTIARQLPEDGRVPALYAYLVNARGGLSVSPNWDAAAYDAAHPEAGDDAAGAVGHAWRAARSGAPIPLGRDEAQVDVAWSRVLACAIRAAERARTGFSGVAHLPDLQPPATRLVLCVIDSTEPAFDEGIELAAALASEPGTRVVLALAAAPSGVPAPDAWIQAGLVTLWQPDITVTAVTSESPVAAALAMAGAQGLDAEVSVVAVRGPGEEIDEKTMVELLAEASRGPVAPILVAHDGTIASAGIVVLEGSTHHLLAGHPLEDGQALGDVRVRAQGGETRAWPVAQPGPPIRILTSTSVVTSSVAPAADSSAPLSTDDDLASLLSGSSLRPSATGTLTLLRPPRSVTLPTGESVPSLRWAIKISAPAGREGRSWGDTHFAAGLARALRKLGQEVVVDSFDARNRPSSGIDDVVLVLRGPYRVDPVPTAARSLLWVLSHPEEITTAEVSLFDRVFAASTPWALEASQLFSRDIVPLLQCTDADRFRPQGGLARGGEIVFVGTAKNIERPAVLVPIRAGIPVDVYGPDWRRWIPADRIRAAGVAHAELPALYQRAGVVLNDHWPGMKANGFISNRPYDVVAAGGRVVSDDVRGLAEHFAGAVRVYHDDAELVALLSGDLDDLFPSEEHLVAVSARIRAEDSFDARARALLDAALD